MALINKNNMIQDDVLNLLEKKDVFFNNVVQKTLLHVQKNKILDVLGMNDVNKCIQCLQDFEKNKRIVLGKRDISSSEELVTKIQELTNEFSSILKLYGTESFEDLLGICFGGSLAYTDNSDLHKFELLKKYFHPTGYSIFSENKNENLSNSRLYCQDISQVSRQFHLKVYGIKVIIYSSKIKKFISIAGIIDDIYIELLKNTFIDGLKEELKKRSEPNEDFTRFISSLSLKDYLTNDSTSLYNKYNGYTSQLNLLKQKDMSIIIKEFIASDLYSKRLTITQLLINSEKCENQYLAYLLYDIISNDTNNGVIDTLEQTILFDSFSWSIKKMFRDAMKKTVQYTTEISNNFDMNKIPLEQQICLLNVSDSVKEKAMMRLKEVKTKSEDSGTKARQYLEGLLKIPFNIFKREKVLNIMEEVGKEFKEELESNASLVEVVPIKLKEKYTGLEISNYIQKIIKNYSIFLDLLPKKELVLHIKKINKFIKDENIHFPKISTTEKNKSVIIKEFINICSGFVPFASFSNIETKLGYIKDYMLNVNTILNNSVHGHDKAKKQISRIIGQWINGEQDGYCFGFEGPPGVGKTSLAKYGLSNCLKDEQGNSRPFAMIQMGGDSNGSTLHGHNYTYVGSTWGSIVQILIDKKCMNPIIFIDELDKISKTEAGKEIVGILTHLLDTTQNDCFQDKYFSGIDLDLSKALFILSYNDAELVDRILLDRIHRIKFSSLTLEEKIVICRQHILPEIYKKMGLYDIVSFSNNVLKFIIEEYTSEPGVRKLKELLFEIVSEVNLDILLLKNTDQEFPIEITIENLKTNYLKDNISTKNKQIHQDSKVGLVNGMWANSLGRGGIIPIQCQYYPSESFMELKLTGMQGDVMKESMNVAQTLAWSLTEENVKKELRKKWEQPYSLHVHCPEGAVPKDGPSAGTAITTVIYSLLNERKIKNTVAITGEISLDGSITEIGGLDLKILGGIKAGVKEFIYPCENKKDFDDFMEKYKESTILNGISFHAVSKIEQVFELVFVV